MPGVPASRRRPFNTRVRGQRAAHHRSGIREAQISSEPPRKRRRYVPGGPGGGGRFVEVDGIEVIVGGSGPEADHQSEPRGRLGLENAASGMPPTPYQRPRRESRRERPMTRPRYSSAAAAAAAVVQGDPFKPREERGWEEFHQELDIEAQFPVFSAEEVDGTVKILCTPTASSPLNPRLLNGEVEHTGIHEEGKPGIAAHAGNTPGSGPDTPSVPVLVKKRPGRPFRRPDSMLKGIGTPDTPKVVPLPGPNPREKLTLPRPLFRRVDPFEAYETKGVGQLNYVDRTMASVGYQESDIYLRPEKTLIRVSEGGMEEDLDLAPALKADGDPAAAIGGIGLGRVEYDMDEQDQRWLEEYNQRRKTEQVEPIKPAIFEITMTKIEKEWHALEKRIPKPNPKPPQTHRPRSSSAAAVNGEPATEEQDSKCAICDDGDCENTNAIVFCDGCDLAVHQECYGVPFIPEGQWLCRKCQLIGRGTPTCIFCPNTDGAFKQTNSSRWSHLLCAIWIPEVSLGNTTFMEPVMEVEKVPKPRWKLTCYICRQKMGACIQCGNKNCFVAFHVTCARRAKLFLQMKSTPGGPASLDSSHLKAFCDKHVPNDWRKDNDTDEATAEAMDHYRHTMRGRLWADSQQSAMNLTTDQSHESPLPTIEDSLSKITLILGSNKRKRNQPAKLIWKLPSGAPVIPAVVYDAVEGSLQRFAVRKRRDFAADMCKYWTLKREARRGAALIKRLQLQMETFSSMEITRRNFVGMGAAGAVRLQRRIEFAEDRLHDVDQLKMLAELAVQREEAKLRDAELLRDLIDTIYFPIPPLLWPILDKAVALDGKTTFRAGLSRIRERLEHRFYTSVSTFSADLGTVFSSVIGMTTIADTVEVQNRIIGDKARKDLTAEQKEKRKLAKRIIKAIQPALESAMRKESELNRKPFEKELRDLDLLLHTSLSSRRPSSIGSLVEEVSDDEADEETAIANVTHDSTISQERNPGAHTVEPLASETPMPPSQPEMELAHQPTPESLNPTPSIDGGTSHRVPSSYILHPPPPPTPPLSSSSDHITPLAIGGIPWYMEPFDPHGTTFYEERWTGREVARNMSEELSDMDDDELSGLVELGLGEDTIMEDSSAGPSIPAASEVSADQAKTVVTASRKKKNGKARKRWRGFR